jgi:prepilin-type processing-associated H-X9-DG protein
MGQRRRARVQSDRKSVYELVIPTLVCPSEVYRKGVDASWWGHFSGRTGNATGTLAMTSYAPSMGNQYMDNDYAVSCSQLGFINNVVGTLPNQWYSSDGYMIIHGNNSNPKYISGPFARETWAASIAQITDGESNTIAMGEVRQYCGALLRLGWMHEDGVWVATTGPINSPTCPGEQGTPADNGLAIDSLPALQSCHCLYAWNRAHAFKSPHTGGATFVFCDGSVHFLNEAIDYVTYQRLGDRRDGQTPNANY